MCIPALFSLSSFLLVPRVILIDFNTFSVGSVNDFGNNCRCFRVVWLSLRLSSTSLILISCTIDVNTSAA